MTVSLYMKFNMKIQLMGLIVDGTVSLHVKFNMKIQFVGLIV